MEIWGIGRVVNNRLVTSNQTSSNADGVTGLLGD